MNKKKLGRGLGELLGNDYQDTGRVLDLSVDRIVPNPWQPRQDFDEESLSSLASSIKKDGLIQPVAVRGKGSSSYELITGERRWRAAKMAGLATIPAIILDYDDRGMAEMALVENLQRKDLNPIEEGMAYKKLMDTYGLTQDEVSRKVGRSRPYIANIVRLLELPQEIKDFLSAGKLTSGQARPLLSMGSDAERITLARRIVSEGLSARRVEELVKTGKPGKTKKEDPVSEYLKAIEEKMGLSVGTKVRIRVGKGKNAHRGTISISFKNDEEFQRITELLDSQGK